MATPPQDKVMTESPSATLIHCPPHGVTVCKPDGQLAGVVRWPEQCNGAKHYTVNGVAVTVCDGVNVASALVPMLLEAGQ